MNIVVCIKQVPDTKGGVKFNPDGTLDRASMLAIMNPDDKAGLEAALRIQDQNGAKVTVLTMGLPKAEEVLREAIGEAVHLDIQTLTCLLMNYRRAAYLSLVERIQTSKSTLRILEEIIPDNTPYFSDYF